MDIVLSPLFTTVVALGLVGLIILRSIYGLGSANEFEKQKTADDIGLLADSLYAVRPDANFVVNYEAPIQFGITMDPKLVTVYEKEPKDGKIFWFTEDKAYPFSYGNFPPRRKDPNIRFFKEGNRLGVLPPGVMVNLATPTCSKRAHPKLPAKMDLSTLANLGTGTVEIATGSIMINARGAQGPPLLKLYVNNNPESAYLACSIAQSLFSAIPFEGYAIIPINPELLAPDDPRKVIVGSKDLAVFIDISLPIINAQAKGNLAQAITSGVTDFVV